MKIHSYLSTAVLAVGLLFLPASSSAAAEAPLKKEKLQIVICLGQSNMVGVADVKTAWYPTYDPKVGYEVAGLIWFQGYSDLGNPAYGELLAQMIRDFREKVKTPKMPVVCGTLGMEGFKNSAFSNDVNAGMLAVSKMPEFAGTVGMVNTSPFYPQEFELLKQVTDAYPPDSREHKEALRMKQRAVSEKGFHYHGSAKFFLLNGDALARSLAGLMPK